MYVHKKKKSNQRKTKKNVTAALLGCHSLIYFIVGCCNLFLSLSLSICSLVTFCCNNNNRYICYVFGTINSNSYFTFVYIIKQAHIHTYIHTICMHKVRKSIHRHSFVWSWKKNGSSPAYNLCWVCIAYLHTMHIDLCMCMCTQ